MTMPRKPRRKKMSPAEALKATVGVELWTHMAPFAETDDDVPFDSPEDAEAYMRSLLEPFTKRGE